MKAIKDRLAKVEKLDTRFDILGSQLGSKKLPSRLVSAPPSLEGKVSHSNDNIEPPKPSVERIIKVPIDVATMLAQQEHIAESKERSCNTWTMCSRLTTNY